MDIKKKIRDILKEQVEKTKPKVIFVGGLDYGSYKRLPDQESLLLNGLGAGIEVVSYNYKSQNDIILNELSDSPNAYVVLFSAGCSKSGVVASKMEDSTKLYVVEPHPSAKIVVNKAEQLGAKVYFGSIPDVGKGISPNAMPTPGCSQGKWNIDEHWCALGSIGKLIRNRINSTKK